MSIIRHSGVVFEGEQGRKYASVIARIVETVQAGLEEISGEENDGVCGRLVLFIISFGSNVVFSGSYSIYEDQNETTRINDFTRCVSYFSFTPWSSAGR